VVDQGARGTLARDVGRRRVRSECAAELGTTRNAVLGKVHRLNLRSRDKNGAFIKTREPTA
jgi:hypothetical protein